MSHAFDVITARVVSLLEAGTVPWRKPWANRFSAPRNLISRRPYRGVNVFLLACASYDSPYWLTFRQAKNLGGHVRKGEKGMPVVFWNWLDKVDAETGKTVEIPFLKLYYAFNVAQCEGLPTDKVPSTAAVVERPFSPITACEHVVKGMQNRPEIRHGFTGASYVPSLDEVRMPAPERFEHAEGYYATVFHELTHATGHASRLNRKGIVETAAFGSDTYGREELVAEMGSAFLCGHAGIETATIDNAAAYLAGWLRAIRQDNRLVVTAAAQAQKAADYILGQKGDEAGESEAGE
jgi:antirestriction protein ArdC